MSGALIGCVVLATCLTMAGPAWAGSTAPSGTRAAPLAVLQMNLCNSGFAGCYSGRSVTAAAAVIRSEAPDLVTLNEVCRDDVAALERALADVHGGGATSSAFQPAFDRSTGGAFRCRNGQPYGIGLVTRRSPSAVGLTSTSGIYPVQDTADTEERAWLCVDAVDFEACTTHLANDDATVAQAQCDYLLHTVIPGMRARGGPARVVLGGDLNLRVGGTPDVRSCVPDDDQRVDDGGVQNVVVTPEFVVASRRALDMGATTDHPGLLITLDRQPPAPASSAGLLATYRRPSSRRPQWCRQRRSVTT